MSPRPPTLHFANRTTIELENSSWVVERGVRHTEWFVLLGSVWARVAEVPGVVVSTAAEDPEDGTVEAEEFRPRPPGCQYLCRFRLLLPYGTAVRRRVSRPRDARRTRPRAGAPAVAGDLQRDILHFFKYAKPPLAVVETEFRIARGGLVSLDRWEKRLARARG